MYDDDEEVDEDDAWLLLAEPEEVVEMMDEIAIGLGSKSTLSDMMQDADAQERERKNVYVNVS